MKKFLLACILNLVYSYSGFAQDSLLNSIGYSKTFCFGEYGRKLFADVETGYPDDMTSSRLFFVEIDESDIYGNKGFMGKSPKKINKNLVSKMNKTYPFQFDSFKKEFKYHDKAYFLEQGYRYRLLIQSKWYDAGGDTPQWKQNFVVLIEDLETGTTYRNDTWYWHFNYVDKFIASCK